MSDRMLEAFRVDHVDGMVVEWDVGIPAGDGLVLRSDVFRPVGEATSPALLSYGPYAKGLPFQTGYPTAWGKMVRDHPDVLVGSSGKYQNWEVVDPEKWVPRGFACVRVDSRGAGRSPGFLDPFSEREIQDFYDCIEWVAAQPWCSGRVGLAGISYYAMNQWLVAQLQPPHLAAMCVWEGAADWYRDATYHGGIRTTFWDNWYQMQVTSVQHGLGERGPRHPLTGLLVCGDETLTEAELAANRTDLSARIREHPLIDGYHQARTPDWSRIRTPFLSAGNWGGQGLHLRGNVTGFERAATFDKWLEMHEDTHWSLFYADYGVRLQSAFFDRFLKGDGEAWPDEPRVRLRVRRPDGGVEHRTSSEWPVTDTEWSCLYLDTEQGRLTDDLPHAGHREYQPGQSSLSFDFRCDRDVEICGPLAVLLYVEPTASDADVFVIVQAFDEDGGEITFQGALDPHTPIGQGWLRLSHRALDPALSLPHRPVHRHDRVDEVEPGTVYAVEIEILPTSLRLSNGYLLRLTIQGSDYVHGGAAARLSNLRNPLTGCGPFVHDDVNDRPGSVFARPVVVHSGAEAPSRLLVPFVNPS